MYGNANSELFTKDDFDKPKQVEIKFPAFFKNVRNNHTEFYMIEEKDKQPMCIDVLSDTASFGEALLTVGFISQYRNSTVTEWNEAVDKANEYLMKQKM
jgi:hypothetical protein